MIRQAQVVVRAHVENGLAAAHSHSRLLRAADDSLGLVQPSLADLVQLRRQLFAETSVHRSIPPVEDHLTALAALHPGETGLVVAPREMIRDHRPYVEAGFK